MSDTEKIIAYEAHIEDMLHVLQERLDEFDEIENKNEFEDGRQLAYFEMMDIIRTRQEIIWLVLADDEEETDWTKPKDIKTVVK